MIDIERARVELQNSAATVRYYIRAIARHLREDGATATAAEKAFAEEAAWLFGDLHREARESLKGKIEKNGIS